MTVSLGGSARGSSRKRWTTELSSDVLYGPVLGNDGKVYAGTRDKTLVALDAADGHQLWSFHAPLDVTTFIVTGQDGTVYTENRGRRQVEAIHSETGARKWTFEAARDIVDNLAVDRAGTLYVGSGDGTLYALEETSWRDALSGSDDPPSGHIPGDGIGPVVVGGIRLPIRTPA